ncbi:MAG: STAS domain-containing protein [Chloroflexi bacterium]|nr:STAS domain-containing protein [Chloroflexota bacterium]
MINRHVNPAKQAEILYLEGRFDVHSLIHLRSWQPSLTLPHIILELSRVNFVDSAALAWMVRLSKQVSMLNGSLQICGLQQPVQIILELTRLDRVLALTNSLDEALAKVPA